ncbi:hypothetical protein ACWDA3_61550 [Nonomuraea rubra]
MNSFEPRVRVRVGKVSLAIPADLIPQPSAPIDSESAVFEGGGLLIVIDQGPFAPSLDVNVGRPEFGAVQTEVGDSPARLINFENEDGAYTTAVEVAAPVRMTVVVRADGSVPRQVPLEIVRSVQSLA